MQIWREKNEVFARNDMTEERAGNRIALKEKKNRAAVGQRGKRGGR